MPGSQELMENFVSEFGLTTTFQQVYDKEERLRVIASQFLQETVKKRDAEQHYKYGFSQLLENYIDSLLNPRVEFEGRNQYNINGNNFLSFVEKYEEIMQAVHEESNSPYPRMPYQKVASEVYETVTNRLTELSNRSIIEIWTDRLSNGKLDLGKMRDLFKKEEMSISNKMLMHNSMKSVIANRSVAWYFNPLNWRDWHHQRNFMKELNEQVSDVLPANGANADEEDFIGGNLYENFINTNSFPLINAHDVTRLKTDIDNRILPQIFEEEDHVEELIANTADGKESVNETSRESMGSIDLNEPTVTETSPTVEKKEDLVRTNSLSSS